LLLVSGYEYPAPEVQPDLVWHCVGFLLIYRSQNCLWF